MTRSPYDAVVECDEPTYFPKRQAYIMRKGKKIGVFGIVHPVRVAAGWRCVCSEV